MMWIYYGLHDTTCLAAIALCMTQDSLWGGLFFAAMYGLSVLDRCYHTKLLN